MPFKIIAQLEDNKNLLPSYCNVYIFSKIGTKYKNSELKIW